MKASKIIKEGNVKPASPDSAYEPLRDSELVMYQDTNLEVISGTGTRLFPKGLYLVAGVRHNGSEEDTVLALRDAISMVAGIDMLEGK